VGFCFHWEWAVILVMPLNASQLTAYTESAND